jgi:hypothetical protein
MEEFRMNDFMTWTTLATFAGCATGTAVITQFIKNIKPLKNIPTQYVSYGIALFLLFAATYFTGALTGQQAAIIPFNAIVIDLASNGAFSALDRVNSSVADKNAVANAVVTSNESLKPAEEPKAEDTPANQ